MKQKLKKVNKKIYLIFIIAIVILVLICYVTTGKSITVENFVYNKIAMCISLKFTVFQKFISRIGSASFVSFYCFLLILFKKTRKRIGVATSISVFVSQILNIILKNIFKRQRPSINPLVIENGYSFPSGHAMVDAAFYIIILLIILKYVRNNKIKYGAITFCIFMPIIVGFSRVYLGVHYLCDVLVGYLIGTLIAMTTYLIIERINNNQIKLLPDGKDSKL